MTLGHGDDDPAPKDDPDHRAQPDPHDPDGPSGGDSTDIDAAFAEIVARFAENDSPVGPWSATEDVPQDPSETDPPDDTPVIATGPAAAEEDQRIYHPDAIQVPPTDAGETDGDGFVPPDPPLPSGDPIGRLAWLGVIAGPLSLLLAVIANWQVTTLFLTVSLGALVVGFVLLVARLPADRDDDPDDGAVV
jgi:hypothetical protein